MAKAYSGGIISYDDKIYLYTTIARFSTTDHEKDNRANKTLRWSKKILSSWL